MKSRTGPTCCSCARPPITGLRYDLLLAGVAQTLPVAGRLRGVISSPVREILALTDRPGVVSFAGGLPAPELFDAPACETRSPPFLRTASPVGRCNTRRPKATPRCAWRSPHGWRPAGFRPTPGDLLITSGSQQALTLVATVLLEPGDRVLVEEPSYLAALQCFQLAGAQAVPVPCDDDGLDPEALAQLVAEHRPKLLYTVPTFHNPTGRTLPLSRRREIAAVAARTGLWIVEDDPYGELRYRGESLAWIASLPEAESRTLALSTLSKIAAPGLRIGWVRAPAPLRRPLTIAKQAADLHSSTVDQAAAARWLATIDLDAHLTGLCAAYGARRDALVAGLAAALPPGSSHNHPDGGMFVWARLPEGWDATELLPRALARDVAYVPGAPFFTGPPDPACLRFSFTAHPPEEIRVGLDRLAAALR